VALDNAALAELLALEAETASGHVARAFRRASRRAFTWPVEAASLRAEARSLTELSGVGPFLAKQIASWMDEEVDPPEPPPIRASFLTLTEARRSLGFEPRGDLQMHTTWSDGGDAMETMALAARQRGYEYIAITDHSAGLRIVKGPDEEGLARQGLEIDRLNERIDGLHVFRSVEMNLNRNGEGDLREDALRRLDLVLASFHSQLRKTDDQTDRYLAAVRNPFVHILGHPRGRIYNHRLGLTCDWEKVFAAAAEADTAVEIDSYPDRQDLDVDLLEIARGTGVRISIGTDAHAEWQLEWIDLGVAAATKAGIAHDRILNLMGAADIAAWPHNPSR
jgi:histidinol phosphatase-like PHP family hydrolase